jgi:membrane-bound lytic murein transglycosylase B
MRLTAFLARLVIPALLVSPALADDYTQREDVQAFIDRMVNEHELDREWLTERLAGVERQEQVLESIANPAEALPWHRYRPIFMTRERIEAGVRFWDEHADVLERAQAEFGVPPELVVAIIGVETFYGRHQGRHAVLDSLVTLGFDYPPRADFFRSELEELFLLAAEENLDLDDLQGSYAGAMGTGQFIASSYRAYAVDFDGDGRRDLFRNRADAIGSVANYFARHRWKPGHAIVIPAALPGDATSRPEPDAPVSAGELRDTGLVFSDGIAADRTVRPIRLEQVDGEEWWLGLHNFYVITRYNHSPLYAMAAWQLSQAIQREREQRAQD